MKNTNQKSKVCTIANRLARQGTGRPEAFRRAWELAKAGTIETKVAGVTYGNRQKALERLTQYNADEISVTLERDRANEFDGNAIAVIVTVRGKGSYTIGYLDKRLAAMFAPLMDAQKAVGAAFREIRGKYQSWHNYGLAVAVSI